MNRPKSRQIVFLSMTALGLTATAAAVGRRAGWFQQVESRKVYDSHAYEVRSDLDASQIPFDTIVELDDRLTAGLPPPPGFTVMQSLGRVKGTLTGLMLASGEQQLVVTIVDEAADLQSAELYVDGALEFSASLANGSIIERNGLRVATMSTFVADSTTKVMAAWTDSSGFTFSDEVRRP